MYARVVRFTDVDPDHLTGRVESGARGPARGHPGQGNPDISTTRISGRPW